MVEYHNNLRFTGIPDLKEKHEIPLPSVFVMQRVVEEIEEFKIITEKDYFNKDVGYGARENYEVLDPSKDSYKERNKKVFIGNKRSEAIKFDKIFDNTEKNNFVILGDPGTGKSSLLKYLLLKYAIQILEGNGDKNLFPIFIEIRKFENAFKKGEPGYKILDYLYDCVNDDYQISLPHGFFEKYMHSGEALILFDGLDEVAAESRRAEIRNKINMFNKSVSWKNSVIITSRIPGYNKTSFSTDNYRHFYLEQFNEDEIKEFIGKWYKTREKIKTEAERKTEDLIKTIEDRPQIKELAKNPLLLTIIGIIHRYEAQLPQDRLALYDKASEALLQTWDNIKEIIDQKFQLDDKRRFLEKLAIHLQSLEKGDESTVVIDKNDLYEILLPEFEKVFDCDKRKARTEVNNFLNVIRTRTGLLNEIGQDQWGFVHKTFQEYFAAKYLQEESDNNYDPQIIINHIDKYIDNPFWQETLLLTLRAIPNKQTIKILQYICDKDKEGINKYLHHNHYFVIKFIAEQGGWLKDYQFVKKTIEYFLQWSIKNMNLCYSWHNFIRERFIGIAKFFTDKTSTSCFQDQLLLIVEDKNQDADLHLYSAEAIGKLGNKDTAANILFSIAEDKNQNTSLRCNCAEVIGRLGNKHEAIFNRLLSIAEDKNQDADLRFYSAEAIGQLGNKDTAANILFSIAEDKNQDADIRLYSADTIGNLGNKDKAVMNRLLSIVEDKNQDANLRAVTAYTAGNLANTDKAVVNRLLSIAEDKSQDTDLRRNCIDAIGNFGNTDKAVIDRLLSIAEDKSQNTDLRCNCAYTLGYLGNKEVAVNILFSISKDNPKDAYMLYSYADAIGNFGNKEVAVDILLSIAEDKNQDAALRCHCVDTIGHLEEKDEAIINRLLSIAKDKKQDTTLRCHCTNTIGYLGKKYPAVINSLLSIAKDKNQSAYLRCDCAEAIGNLGNKTDGLRILSELYSDFNDKESDKSKSIYKSLWELTAVE